MPRRRRVLRKRRKSMYNVDHVAQLRHGHSYFSGQAFGGERDGLYPGVPGWEEAKAAWPIFRDEILLDWIRDAGPHWRPQGPATRPWGWWAFDAPELRRRVDGGGVHPFDNEARTASLSRHAFQQAGCFRTSFGLPSLMGKGEGFNDFECQYEFQFQYLDRLQLFLAGELAAFVPLLAAWIAKVKAEYTTAEKEPTTRELDSLRQLDADLARFRAQLGATS